MFASQRYRTLLSFVLAIAAIFVVGCSSAPPAPPLYTPEQINLIEKYETDLEGLRSRVSELSGLIDNNDWTNVRNLIHGPLGELRFKMLTIARNLSSSDQAKARDLSREVFKYLVAIDSAAVDQNRSRAVAGYDQLVDAYERFINTIPREASS